MDGYCFNKWSDWIRMRHTAFREVREATVLNCQMRHWDGRTSVKWMKKSNVKWNSKFWKIYCCCNQSYFCFYCFFFANCSMSKNLPKKKKTKISKHPTYTPAPTSRTKIICYLCVHECEKRVCINGLQREILCEKQLQSQDAQQKSNMRVVREIGA